MMVLWAPKRWMEPSSMHMATQPKHFPSSPRKWGEKQQLFKKRRVGGNSNKLTWYEFKIFMILKFDFKSCNVSFFVAVLLTQTAVNISRTWCSWSNPWRSIPRRTGSQTSRPGHSQFNFFILYITNIWKWTSDDILESFMSKCLQTAGAVDVFFDHATIP